MVQTLVVTNKFVVPEHAFMVAIVIPTVKDVIVRLVGKEIDVNTIKMNVPIKMEDAVTNVVIWLVLSNVLVR